MVKVRIKISRPSRKPFIRTVDKKDIPFIRKSLKEDFGKNTSVKELLKIRIKRLKGKDFQIKNLSKEEERKVKIFKDRRGFITKVVNPKGKGRVVIVQTTEPGFTIKSVGKGGRERKLGRGLTEKSAIRRALGSGKRTITFRD